MWMMESNESIMDTALGESMEGVRVLGTVEVDKLSRGPREIRILKENRLHNYHQLNPTSIGHLFIYVITIEPGVYIPPNFTAHRVVAKCLTGRPKMVEKAKIVLMLWVELEAMDVFLVHTR
ncbi:hypothetical protein L1987_14009 [Smallanthus sonchifolius]|uniref:Uncharacterized protein n=1 Tax=Smallanthus sonchifolius TaxID=185202 RepID=A0ACB9JKA6_9ASTR|nr:hypothetical protein L1987_14009 [Smallanthus sonchifolius]